MSRKLAVFVMLTCSSFGGCLVIDTTQVIPAACGNGNCQTGPGIVNGEMFKASLTAHIQIVGHNSCKTKTPLKGLWLVELSFYDKDSYRIGIHSIQVAQLEVDEKFKHEYELPGDVLMTSTIKVRSLKESPDIN